MATKGKKKGTKRGAQEEILVEEKENVQSRRAGRDRKQINYCEESPAVKKKAKEPVAKLEKVALQNSRKKTSSKENIPKVEPVKVQEETKNDKSSKSKAKSKGKSAKVTESSEVVKETPNKSRTNLDDSRSDNLNRSRRGKRDAPPVENLENSKPSEKKKLKEDFKETKENQKSVSPSDKKKATNKKVQRKGKAKKVADENEDITDAKVSESPTKDVDNACVQNEDINEEPSEKDFDIEESASIKTPEKQNLGKGTNRSNKKTKANKPTKEPDSLNDSMVSEQDSAQNKNSTFTLDSVTMETPVTTNPRRTPASNFRQKTPSSANRVSEVLDSIRRDSLAGSKTPTSSHCDCAERMTQVYEILQLVTDQLTDLKTEMESVKSTNETLQTEIETSRHENKKLQEDVNSLKIIQQMTATEEQQKRMPMKSSPDQNEIDLLWEQCSAQKKTIRSLHNEVDATKQHFNDKFEKYKQAMVFILCKTQPGITHADVAKLRHLLNKTEKSLELTLDEICANMEGEIQPSSRVTPSIEVTQGKSSNQKMTESIQQATENRPNIKISQRDTLATPSNANPFQSKPKLQRTPIAEK